MSGFHSFAGGPPVEYIKRGAKEVNAKDKHNYPTLKEPIENQYGTEVSEDVANTIQEISRVKDADAVVRAISKNDLDEGGERSLAELVLDLDETIQDSHCRREKLTGSAWKKSNRERVYIPHLINECEGDVYMAKSISSSKKVRIAWGLSDDNEVIVVDDYEPWQKLLGWKKLKDLPHGKNKIREMYGDVLSEDVLKAVTGGEDSSQEAKEDDTSNGRRTRTKPSDEVLNLSTGTRQSQQSKHVSKEIAEDLENDGYVRDSQISVLVLFPTTTSKKLSDHRWISGTIKFGESCAIANCNKGTFEYLNRLEQVWHIEDFLDQAYDQVFETNDVPMTPSLCDMDNSVFHVMRDERLETFSRPEIIENMPEAMHDYVYNYRQRGHIDLPHKDDFIYAPISSEQAFWLSPALREATNDDDCSVTVASGNGSVGGVSVISIPSGNELYARARLPNWDYSGVEIAEIDNVSYRMDFSAGGKELIETLAMTHDQGRDPYSEIPEPQKRWDL